MRSLLTLTTLLVSLANPLIAEEDYQGSQKATQTIEQKVESSEDPDIKETRIRELEAIQELKNISLDPSKQSYLDQFKLILGERYIALRKNREKSKYFDKSWEKANPKMLKRTLELYSSKVPLENKPYDISRIPKQRMETYFQLFPWIDSKNITYHDRESIKPIEEIFRVLEPKKE